MRKSFIGLVLLLSLLIAIPKSFAAEPTFKDATGEYQAGHYQKALIAFEKFREHSPENVLVHYYEALCYQGLNALDKAREEFNYVIGHDSGDLRVKSQAGLKRLQNAKTEKTGGPMSGLGDNRLGRMDLVGQREGHTWQIVQYLDMNRCKDCKTFGNIWTNILRNHDTAAATHIDIETGDPSLTLYHVNKRHPFLVLLDGVGKVQWSGMAPLKEKEILDLLDRYR